MNLIGAFLLTVKADRKQVEDIDYLLIERYDRQESNAEDNPPAIQRLHHEDFCQAKKRLHR